MSFDTNERLQRLQRLQRASGAPSKVTSRKAVSFETTVSDVPEALRDFFEQYPRVALAYSGGVDSAYLLACAIACDVEIYPYRVASVFQYPFETDDADLVSMQLDAPYTTLNIDVLADENIAKNPWNRCYYCKKRIFSTILDQARTEQGIEVLVDGTNASDNPDNRPGFKALAELGVLSPLRLAGLTKEDIRKHSAQMGLITADKPSVSCRATVVPTDTPLTQAALEVIEHNDWKNNGCS